MAAEHARLGALDGWRAVAVSMVVVHHVIRYSALRSRIPPDLRIAGDFGPLGVHIFFVISGYVITMTIRKEFEDRGRLSLRAFYIRRCFRILPPLWCYLAFVATLSRAGLLAAPIAQVWNAAAFLCNLPVAACENWHVTHTWTLAYEEQFYLLLPPCMLFVLPKRRYLAPAILFISPVAIVLCYLVKARFLAEYLTIFQFLLAGVATALYSEKIGRRVRKLRPWAIYLFIFAVFAVEERTAIGAMTVVRMVLGPLIGIVLLYTSRFPCAAGTFLSNPGIRFVGRISYGIYLWQQVATGYYPGAGAVFYACSLGLTAAVAAVSFVWIEQPLIGFAARLSKARIAADNTTPDSEPRW